MQTQCSGSPQCPSAADAATAPALGLSPPSPPSWAPRTVPRRRRREHGGSPARRFTWAEIPSRYNGMALVTTRPETAKLDNPKHRAVHTCER